MNNQNNWMNNKSKNNMMQVLLGSPSQKWLVWRGIQKALKPKVYRPVYNSYETYRLFLKNQREIYTFPKEEVRYS